MNKQEKIEAIRQECIRHNKEITELKFGCKIKVSWGEAIITGKRYEGFWMVDWSGAITSSTWIQELSILQIIGRPITLPDVLLAIKKSKEISSRQAVTDGWVGSVTVELFADDDEGRAEISTNEAYRGIWNLLKPLEDQEEPTISFIYELVK